MGYKSDLHSLVNRENFESKMLQDMLGRFERGDIPQAKTSNRNIKGHVDVDIDT